MPNLTIPNTRQDSTVLLHTRLKDNGVAVDWSGLSDVRAFFYSDIQKVIAGKCEVAVGGGDSTVLDVLYAATKPQYLGVNRLLVRCTYQGREKTFDLPVVNFVERTAQATGVVTLDDPELSVTLEVSEVSTSLLDGAIAAALDAADEATAAAADAREAAEEAREAAHGGGAHAITYDPQDLTAAQKAQARENIGAGTYSKPANGIPASDLAEDARPQHTVSKTYAQLKAMRDGGTLTPGTAYRITDYVATTSDSESRSAGHPFDIIVTAIDESHLSEEGWACKHEGDSYFAGVNFDMWRVWYTIDNDTSRHMWADSVNGKGVVYRLIDEWKNDVPYDFKGIQFKRYKVTAKTAYADTLSPLNGLYIGLSGNYSTGFDIDSADFKWYYTFSKLGDEWSDDVEDGSLVGSSDYACNNEFGATDYAGPIRLNNIVCANGACLRDFILAINPSSTASEVCICNNCHFEENTDRLSLFGPNSNNFGVSQFRENIILGTNRHNRFATDFENNAIAVFGDFCFNDFGSYCHGNVIYAEHTMSRNATGSRFVQNHIKVTGATTQFGANRFGAGFLGNYMRLTADSNMNVFGQSFHDNTVYGQVVKTCFSPVVSDNTFGTEVTPAKIDGCRFSFSLNRNTFLGTHQQNYFDGQITDCEFGDRMILCHLVGMFQYVNVPAGTSTSMFSAVDIKGTIRGEQGSPVVLDAAAFRLSTLAGISRRVTIEGDANGNITATWMDGGKRVGIYKAAGASAWTELPVPYSKPANGIPASDLASGVIPDVSGKEDKSNKVTSFGSTPSDTKYPSEKLVKDSLDAKQPTIDANHKLDYSLLSNTPTIPTVPTISTNIQTDKASDDKTASPKAVYDEVHPAVASSQPAGGMLPNVVYDLGTLTGTVTFALATPSDANIPNAYHWTFETGGTAPTINWPSGVIFPDGVTPTAEANKHYEVLVRKGYGSIITYSLS